MSILWRHLGFLSVFLDVILYLSSHVFSGVLFVKIMPWLLVWSVALFVGYVLIFLIVDAKGAVSSISQVLNSFVPQKVDGQNAVSNIFTIFKTSYLENSEYLLLGQFKITLIISPKISSWCFL